MSYILDALRKSELERQMATGSRVSLFYPVAVESAARRWREPALTVAVIGLALVVAALGWWLHMPGETLSTPVAVVETVPAPEELKPPVPALVPERRIEEQKAAAVSPPVPERRIDEQKAAAASPPVESPVPLIATNKRKEAVARVTEPVKAMTTGVDAKLAAAGASAAVTEKLEAASDTLPKDFPVLSIAGYIHDDEGNSLAMINDKLVHEGEEVEPGLRLEKILGENSVFVYKGRRFRR
jgi:general secretion pathway protein B